MKSLNWLAGCEVPPDGVATEAQTRALDLLMEAAKESGPTEPLPQPHEAARKLLHARAGYSSDESPVVPFQPKLVSLPPDVHSRPHAVDLLEGRDRDLLTHFENRIVRSDVEFLGDRGQ